MSAKHLKKLDSAKERRRLANALTTVYQVIPELDLTDGLKLAVKFGEEVRCLVRLMFAPQTCDFYLALPYLKVNAYLAGFARAEIDRPATFDMSVGSKQMRNPFKLSYHESGQVHFKPTSNEAAARPPVVTNVTPIRKFDGSHVFTLELEGLHHFQPPKAHDYRRPSFIVYNLIQPKIERLKIVCYGGFASEVVSGKYTIAGKPAPPNLLIKIARPKFVVPLYLGFYFQIGKSIQKDVRVKAFELLISGFDKEDGTFIYSQAALQSDKALEV